MIFYSFWSAEHNLIVAQNKYYVYAFLMSRRENLQNGMNFPSYNETHPRFCCGVFQPPQQECRWYIWSFGAKKIEILALWIVILLSVTQLIILQAACFLFCALMSFDFSVWWSWSFSKILKTVFLTMYRCSWREVRFRWIKEGLLWIDSSFTHFVVYWFWQGVKCTARA